MTEQGLYDALDDIDESLQSPDETDATPEEILHAVQKWMWEHVHFKSDQELFGATQKTVTVEETLKSGYGDCEDYAWCCYVLATSLGVAPASLSICLCLINGAEQHAVLRHSESGLILDNQVKEPRAIPHRGDISNLRELAVASFPTEENPDSKLRFA
jgi:predicted transglutaminase-like cysteine proteinase